MSMGFVGCSRMPECAAHMQERMDIVLPWAILGLTLFTIAMIFICWKIGRND